MNMKETKTNEALKELKSELDIDSNYELANTLNVAQTSIQRYMKGSVSIKVDKLNDLVKPLGLEVEIKYNKIK